MNTPIADFVRNYAEKNMSRLHMPGHKGQTFLGCEQFDITEVAGADALYEADGIIAESEANATSLFGTGRTVYSTEGSSQCIRAMLYLALTNRKSGTRPVVLAARNVHKAFVYAAALLDFEVVWLWPEKEMTSLCSCQISPETLERALDGMDEIPAAVYVTSPDYLGGQLDIAAFAEICHKKGTILAVDNAHGAYLHFSKEKKHPINLGADICSDSAHKTLPVLTGGAYLQISKNAPENFKKYAKSAMALFGSTSPSYLTLISLDLCNQHLAADYKEQLWKAEERIRQVCEKLQKNGWQIYGTESLKLTVKMPEGKSGTEMAEEMRKNQVECEYADPDFVVFMFTPQNTEEDYLRVEKIFGKNKNRYMERTELRPARCEQVMHVREAVFAEHEEIAVADALGRICASPAVSCPPAIPIVVSGEKVDENAIHLFQYYNIESIDVTK
ncbi:MAG: PLP-dependent transferase [Ruminococcus sp.]|nr:PLP-dependent transferase [Ruminococcus sp.]